MALPEFRMMIGICGACGSSIAPEEHHQSTQQCTCYGLPPGPTSYLCASCIKALVKSELRYRCESYVRSLGLSWSKRAVTLKEILMLQPRGTRLLIKRIDTPKPTSSLLVIPETADGEKSNYAIVIAVGNKVTENIKVADTVILTPYCGSPVSVELDGEMLEAAIVMEDDVLAVVED